MSAIRVLLADDHEMVRRGLRSVIESQPGWVVCAEATNGREAVTQAQAQNPNVVVMDVSMPELNGLEATRQIRKLLPRTEVIVLSMHESEQLVREVIAAGAKGYVLKTDAGTMLVQAIAHVNQHQPFFTSKVAELLLQDFLNPAAPLDTGDVLTPREREIVQLIAEGKSSKEIGALLTISVKTADTHRANIMRKLGMHSVSELVRYAIRNKIVEP